MTVKGSKLYSTDDIIKASGLKAGQRVSPAIIEQARLKLQATELFTLGVPHVDGVGTITGTGTCTKGSLVHRLEKCNYKFSGTYDLLTGITQLTLKGTETPAAVGKPGKKHKH